MQAEGDLDDVGDAVVRRTLTPLVLERLGVAARRQEALLEVVGADDAEVLRLDRLAVRAHRRQQLGDAGAVDLLDAEELGERLVRAADFFEHLAPDGGPGQAAKLGDEVAHGAVVSEVAIPGDVGGEVALQAARGVPVRTGRVARPPLLPVRVGGGDLDERLAVPGPAQRQVRIEPRVGLGERLEFPLPPLQHTSRWGL